MSTSRATPGPLDNPHDDGFQSKIPRSIQGILIGVFVFGIISSFIFISLGYWRRGSVGIGTSMLLLAALRLVCDSSVLGVLSVRSRRFDVLFCSLTGLAIVFLALTLSAPSL